ncbi:MAG TPA: DNA polymerase, partial [Planctomycetaceae bacterium]|nr:DNA polymerase [Planctomycetaceae bacterium]
GTYLDALPRMVNPRTGKIHASFHQAVAATGRLSSAEPNLQNIPIRTAEGQRIRRAFIPSEPDWKFVCVDYSQIELRMLAHFCGDPVLCEAFANGIDIHAAVACEIFNVAAHDVSAEQRRIAKAVNFGVLYGQSPFGLAESLHIDQVEATMFIDQYFAKYAGVDAYITRTLAEIAQSGFATTILGRRRAISGIRSQRKRQLNLPERTAINTVIQGSAADLIKQAMLRVHDRLRTEKHPGRLLLQIHDELVFETPAAEVDSLSKLVREEMQSAMQLRVPLVVDVSSGDNWQMS